MCICVKIMIIFHTVKLAMFSTVCVCGLVIKFLSQCISLFSFSVEICLDAQSDRMSQGNFMYSLYHSHKKKWYSVHASFRDFKMAKRVDNAGAVVVVFLI